MVEFTKFQMNELKAKAITRVAERLSWAMDSEIEDAKNAEERLKEDPECSYWAESRVVSEEATKLFYSFICQLEAKIK